MWKEALWPWQRQVSIRRKAVTRWLLQSNVRTEGEEDMEWRLEHSSYSKVVTVGLVAITKAGIGRRGVWFVTVVKACVSTNLRLLAHLGYVTHHNEPMWGTEPPMLRFPFALLMQDGTWTQTLYLLGKHSTTGLYTPSTTQDVISATVSRPHLNSRVPWLRSVGMAKRKNLCYHV